MDVNSLLNKIKKDKKILIPFIGLIFLLFLLIFSVINALSDSSEIQNSNEIALNNDLIPLDSNYSQITNGSKLDAILNKNKNKNIEKEADLLNLMNLTDTNVKASSDSSLPFQKQKKEETNSDQITKKAMSFKERLLAQRNNSNLVQENNTQNQNSFPLVKTSNNQSSSQNKAETKENSKEEEIEQKRRKKINEDFGNFFNENSGNIETQTVNATIHNEGRKVKAGSYVRMRLNDNLTLPNGEIIPRNTIISGISSFGNQRIFLSISNIFFNGERHEVKLEAYGLDGYKGLYAQDIIDKEIAENAISEAESNGTNEVTIPKIGTLGLNILKKKVSEQHTILRDGHKLKLELK